MKPFNKENVFKNLIPHESEYIKENAENIFNKTSVKEKDLKNHHKCISESGMSNLSANCLKIMWTISEVAIVVFMLKVQVEQFKNLT